MNKSRHRALREAETKAEELFAEIATRRLIQPGKTERALNEEIYQLAHELFGITKYWHKRIVRAGPNTLLPYRENPPDRSIATDDILFLDFGPIFEDWEADFGRTYVLGNDPIKHKLAVDVESLWTRGKEHFDSRPDLRAAELFAFMTEEARTLGYSWPMVHCGHLIGEFPHENIPRHQADGMLHADNQALLRAPADDGSPRDWILEVHITLPELQIGAFTERLLTVP